MFEVGFILRAGLTFLPEAEIVVKGVPDFLPEAPVINRDVLIFRWCCEQNSYVLAFSVNAVLFTKVVISLGHESDETPMIRS